MHRRGVGSVTGDAEKADETFVACRNQGFDGATRRHRLLPSLLVDQIMQLNQIDLTDTHPLEGPLETRPGRRPVALSGLRRQEDAVAVCAQPGLEVQLCVAIGSGHVDVVDSVSVDQFERRFDTGGLHCGERRCAEDHASTVETGGAKGLGRDHHGNVASLKLNSFSLTNPNS
jgi:hypothetical protein